MSQQTGFKMSYDKNTIDHLGIKLYSQFPPVIAELISNAYDAEATNVDITIDYQEKCVVVKDNGHGMTHEEINNSFLKIGRNRRLDSNSGLSKNSLRYVTGKKGLGKLAVFGIAKTISVTSITNGLKNALKINYDDLKSADDSDYQPETLLEYEHTEETNGTVIAIEDIHLKNITPHENLSNSLAKRFNFFDEDFQVTIKNLEEPSEPIIVTRDLYLQSLNEQFSWDFPSSFTDIIKQDVSFKALDEYGVTGKIITNETPLKKADAGFNIYARNKMAAQSIFFNERSNDQFHTYVMGYFNIDFIDEDNEKDFIGTARQSVLWDQSEQLEELKNHLDNLVKYIGREWKRKRGEEKTELIGTKLPENFYAGLSSVDQKQLTKIQKSLTSNSTGEEDAENIVKVLSTVRDLFSFESFQEYITELEQTELTLENVEKIASDWELIESKELSKIAKGRIEAINKFETFVNNDESETKVIQPFLEKFPWMLDPRIANFEREKTFARILKENFPDDSLEEKNKRIDFLCDTANGGIIIIELKRPSIKISQKELNQIIEYKIFVEERYKDSYGKKVECFLISENIKMDPNTRILADGLENNGTLKILSYSQLLKDARNYNKEFISQYEKLTEKITNDGL
ncbi:ATP-binding protein [Salinicoccus hispanicus]|uniref:ATP-binding protein n=1 Tax=Salinicoccus hispanicus TaxID=157225 RepID=A0A6N8U0N8_9STAP|nr:ATP-binding protein [Salinicoccus hispanicus]MXQ51332.1 ATP-binding protein [Salinicoccus hispanicus]